MSSKYPKTIMSTLFGHKNKRHVQKEQGKEESARSTKHPVMAIGARLSQSRRGIEAYLGRVQDTLQKSRGVGKVLQSTTRIKEAEEVRERAEKKLRRASEVIVTHKSPGFNEYVVMMRKIEGDAYYNLRDPGKLKKDGLSLDYTVGFYAGALSVIDDFFQIQMSAEKVIRKENIRIKKENEEKQKSSE